MNVFWFVISTLLRLLHFDRFQSIFKARKKSSWKIPKKKHFLLTLHQKVGFVEKGNHRKGNHRINQIKVCTWQFFFRRENEHKQRGMLKNYKRQGIFVARKKKDFCFHVCFNPKLPAKQQQFHCFRAQCSKCVGVNWLRFFSCKQTRERLHKNISLCCLRNCISFTVFKVCIVRRRSDVMGLIYLTDY